MKEYTKFFRNKLLKIVLSSFLFFGFICFCSSETFSYLCAPAFVRETDYNKLN